MVTLGSGRITVQLATKGTLKGAQKQLNKTTRSLKTASAQTKRLSGNMSNLGSRLGFAAFQMTFLAGIAGRALGEIANQFRELIQVASKAEDTIIRAIGQSGIDISSRKSAKAVKFLNDAIRDLGSGRTIFSQEQVAEAAKEIGRAFTFAGNDMQKAGQLALVLKANLRLMTIEQIGAEESAIQLAKIMKQFGLNATQAMEAVNTLVLVNQQSSVTLADLTKSMAAAGNFAREFGVDLNTLAAIMGVVSDRIGIRGSAAGRAFRRILENLSRTSTSLDPKLKALGISIRDDAGQIRNIVDILRDFRNALDRGGKAGSLVRQKILELGTASIRSRDALLALTQGFPQLQASLEGLAKGADTAERLEDIFTATTEAKISRITNAINSLKIDLVSGLSPALTLILEDFRELILDIGVQEFFTNIGSAIGNEFIPIVKRLSKVFTSFANVLKKNKLIIQLLTKGLIAFLTVLTGLFIVTTLGALVLGLSAGFKILAGSQAIVILTTNLLFLSFLRFALFVGLAIVVVRSLVNILNILKGGFEKGEEGAVLFNVALLALSLSAFTLIGRFGIIKKALLGLAASMALPTTAAKGFNIHVAKMGIGAGKGFKANFLGSIKGIPAGLKGLISSLGRAGIIGAAIAAAALIGAAIMIELNRRVDADPFFKTGLASRWELVGFQLQAAVASTIRKIIGFFGKAADIIGAILTKLATSALDLFVGFGEALFNLTNPIKFALAIEKVRKAFDNLTKGLDVGSEIRKFLDAEFGAREEIIKRLKLFRDEGKVFPDSEIVKASIQEVIKAFDVKDLITPDDVADLIRQIFGEQPTQIKETTLGGTRFTEAEVTAAEVLRDETEELKERLIVIGQTLANIDPSIEGMNEQFIAAQEEADIINARLIDIGQQFKKLGIDPEDIDNIRKTLESFKETDKNLIDMNKEITEVIKVVEKTTGLRIEQGEAIIEETEAIKASTEAIEKSTEAVGLISEETIVINERRKKLAEEAERAIEESLKEGTLLADPSAFAKEFFATGGIDPSKLITEGPSKEEILEIWEKALGPIAEEQKQAFTEALTRGSDLQDIANIVLEEQIIRQEKLEALLVKEIELKEAANKNFSTIVDTTAELSDKTVELTDATKIAVDDLKETNNLIPDLNDAVNIRTETELRQIELLTELGDEYENRLIPVVTFFIFKMARTIDLITLTNIAFIELINSIRSLTSRIAGTRAKFIKNKEGKLIDFELQGPFNIASLEALVASLLQGFDPRSLPGLQAGGIVNRPLLANIAERGPEAVIPLDKLGSLGNITNEINITIEGSVDGDTVEDIGEQVAEAINKNIKRSGTVIR